MFIQESGGHMVRVSKIKIKPEHVVHSLMRRPKIFFGIVKII